MRNLFPAILSADTVTVDTAGQIAYTHAMRRGDRDVVTIIKNAIEQSGLPITELARLAGIDHGQLSRFMRGHRDLTLDTAAKLFRPLGLEIVHRQPLASKKRGRPRKGAT